MLDAPLPWRICRAGYQPVNRKKRGKTIGEGGAPGVYIVPQGKRFRVSYPLQPEPNLYRIFANLDGTAESCAGFANSYGLLASESDIDGESLDFWRLRIAKMRRSINTWETDPLALDFDQARGVKVGDLDVILRAIPSTGELRLKLRPRTLLAGMELQLVEAVTAGLETRFCEECNKPITIGPGHHRSHVKFCSPPCRIKFNNRKKLRRARK